MQVTATINGEKRSFQAEPDEKLADALRRLGLTGVKKGCGEGTCGSCVVLLDGRAVNACLVFVPAIEGRQVVTIEGVGTTDAPHPLQTAFVDAGAVQCGFCTPGMVLSAKALLDREAEPTDEQIRAALDGNLCRCTGYVKVIEAVKAAAARLRAGREVQG
jgi:carbon-monoxide dehydrogenase small subunit